MSLSKKLAAALDARDRRLIRRRLPENPSEDEIDFTSNDYLSLASSPDLRSAVLAALAASPHILGSGGSRLLVASPPHADLETRLCRFFDADAALLFNSGFDANVGFFSSIPQPGDIVLYDAHVHASVHEGIRLSRVGPDARIAFAHNSVSDLRRTLMNLDRAKDASVFVAVESLYSMDGTIAPLKDIVACVEELLPSNGYVIVDEAHATGIYGPNGRGLVAELGLEKSVFVRLHTFGKALAATGAVLLTTPLVKDYLLNYAKSLIYTTTLPFSNIIAVHCSFDMLENGTAETLSKHLLELSAYFVDRLSTRLKRYPPSLIRLPDFLSPTPRPRRRVQARPWERDPRDPRTWDQTPEAEPTLQSVPTPIIPVLTPEPRALSGFLRTYASSVPFAPRDAPGPALATVLHTKPIYPPTVPAGTARVRICLHARHTREDVDLLVDGITAWAEMRVADKQREERRYWEAVRDAGVGTWMEAKL